MKYNHAGFALNLCFAAINFSIGGVNYAFGTFSFIVAIICWKRWYAEERVA